MAIDLRPYEVGLVLPRDMDCALEVTLSHNGTAPDITLDVVALTVRDALDGTLIFEKVNLPTEHTTPASGVTTFDIDPTDTAAARADMTTAGWRYEIRRTVAGTGEELVYAYGDVTVYPTI
jgi:hypothetical protein